MPFEKFGITWSFDPASAIIAIVAIPIFYLLLRLAIRRIRIIGRWGFNAILFTSARIFPQGATRWISLKRYADIQLADDTIQFLHVPAHQDIPLDVDTVFVPLTLDYRGRQNTTYSHDNLLELGNRITIVGDPGSGKSSLIKRLFRDECSEINSYLWGSGTSRFPVRLELKTLEIPDDIPAFALGIWLYGKIRDEISKYYVYEIDKCFETYAKNNGLLILLDGLDEINSSVYPHTEQAILSFSQHLTKLGTNNKIIITSRIQFFIQVKDHFSQDFPHTVTINPFTPTDIYEFLTRYPFPKPNRKKTIQRIYEELTDRPTLKEMCSNPLILSMYVAEDQTLGQGQDIPPETRTEFYLKVSEELVVRRSFRQKAQTLSNQKTQTLSRTKLKDTRERILGTLAYYHMLDETQSLNSLQWEDAIKTICENYQYEPSEAAVFFRELSSDTGLITEERYEETFRFIHLTFCEFFAAIEAARGQENGWNHLVETHILFKNSGKGHLTSRLVEVLPFACGLLSRVERDQAINDILDIGDPRIIARTFLETKRYEHPRWKEYLDLEQKSLLNEPAENWNEEWMSRLLLFNVVIMDAQHSYTRKEPKEINLDEFYKDLFTSRIQYLPQLLTTYASTDAIAAWRVADLCHVDLLNTYPEIIVANCDQKLFLQLVISRLENDIPNAHKWATVIAEAALRSKIVALEASRVDTPEAWKHLIRNVKNKQRWIRRETGLNNNLYGSSLLLALDKTLDPSRWPLLHIVNNIPENIGYKLYLPISITFSFIVFIVIVIVMPNIEFPSSIEFMKQQVLPVLGGVMLPSPLFFYLNRSLAERSFYAEVFFQNKLNTDLDDSKDDEAPWIAKLSTKFTGVLFKEVDAAFSFKRMMTLKMLRMERETKVQDSRLP